MRKLSDKDKKIWDFYISNLNFIKKNDKKLKFKSRSIPVISKVLTPNSCFALDRKTKREMSSKKLTFDAVIDLHGKTELQAYETVKNFIKNSYLKNFKSIIIITGKGVNSKGKLKLKTPLWLRGEELSKFIVGFDIMPPDKGGEGALFVKLKNKYKYNN